MGSSNTSLFLFVKSYNKLLTIITGYAIMIIGGGIIMDIPKFDKWMEKNYILDKLQRKQIIGIYKKMRNRKSTIFDFENALEKIGLEYEIVERISNYVLYPQKRR